MSLLRFFAGRVVEIPRMECFGISGLRILPTVAFLYRCTSLYIGRGQVLFQNLLLIIAPSIRGRSEGMFCFQFFIIAELLTKVIDIIPNERHEPFWTQIHWKNPQPDDFLLYVLTVVFFKPSLKCIGWENINSRKLVHCAISEWNEKRHITVKFFGRKLDG